MYQLLIPALSCAHCVAAITKVVTALDSAATLQFAVPEHKVEVRTSTSLDTLKPALAEAGYPVEAVTEPPAHHCEMCG